MNHRKKISVLVVLVVSMMLIVPIQPAKAQFVLASWAFPDEYGQGVDKISVYSNQTGSWVLANWAGDASRDYDESSEFDWNASIFIRLNVWTWFNSTLTGAPSWEEGKKYQRHSVTVNTNNGTQIFSQQNFTFASCFPAINPPLWYYEYKVVLNFLPVSGEIYTVTIDYEIFYDDGSSATTILTATDGSTDAEIPTGSYTDTHSVNDVFFGGTSSSDLSVVLWVELSKEINGFNYSAYWNSSISSNIYIYNHDISDWSLLDSSPNGEGAPLAWDNDTVDNENYYNETTVGFLFQCGIGEGGGINIDHFQIHGLVTNRWHTINSPILMFAVPFDMWGYNMALVFAGLIMIPASTMYLAYGVKHDRTSDRMFYGLIIFAVGFGLLVAGITP